MNIYESAEDYLEQILMLLEQKGHARSIDIAMGLNVSKPSVSVAMKKLRENGYISMSSDNLISLTDKGYAIARKVYDRHQALTKYLIQIGVPEEIAREDACKIEHDLSKSRLPQSANRSNHKNSARFQPGAALLMGLFAGTIFPGKTRIILPRLQ